MKLTISSKYFGKRFLIVFSAVLFVWYLYWLFENEYLKYLVFLVTFYSFFEIIETVFSFQNKKEIEIKNGWIKFPYSCEEYKLYKVNMEIRDFKGLKKVKFFIDNKEIFEWLFSDDELKKFRECLKSYLKTEKFDTSKEIIIFDDGFSVFGRFFGFDEVKSIDLSFVPTRAGSYMAIRINLKDESFTYTIDKDYEKAMLLKLKINNEDCKKREINPLMLILNIMAVVFILSNDYKLRVVGVIIVFFTMRYWYDIIRENYLYKLCKDVKKERG